VHFGVQEKNSCQPDRWCQAAERNDAWMCLQYRNNLGPSFAQSFDLAFYLTKVTVSNAIRAFRNEL
jgi:hypothetical protein